MANWRGEVVSALRAIDGQGSLSEIYEAVLLQAERELPRTWKAIVRRELEHNSSDSESYQGKYDLFFSVDGIGKGVWGLRELEKVTPEAEDLDPPNRVVTHTYRILRDTLMARRIKKLHKDSCQICGEVLNLRDSETYSEAHHIRPLGGPHKGPDVPGNILVLCPNHHALLDYGALKLEIGGLRVVSGHVVDPTYIDYHNSHIAVSAETP